MHTVLTSKVLSAEQVEVLESCMVTDGAAVGTVCWGRAEVRTEMVRKAKVMSVVRSFIVVGLVEGRRVGLGVRKVVVVGGLEKVVGRTEVEVEGLEQDSEEDIRRDI